MGTLFGLEGLTTERLYGKSQYPLRWAPSSDERLGRREKDIRVSQYPLRWAPSSDSGEIPGWLGWCSVSIPSQVGTLFGLIVLVNVGVAILMSQYPLRWAPSSDFVRWPWVVYAVRSQYPLRWAPSSDEGHTLLGLTGDYVSIPSQVGTLFGLEAQYTGEGGACGLNTLSGGHPLRTGIVWEGSFLREDVSIPSQVGTLFGPGI